MINEDEVLSPLHLSAVFILNLQIPVRVLILDGQLRYSVVRYGKMLP
jgi:hypothetical protein